MGQSLLKRNLLRECSPPRDEGARPASAAIGIALFAASLALYISRMAPSVVPGDPGEYQLVAARWGIAHPPGYGLYALFGNLFTHAIPFGSFAWRANLLSAVCGAAIVALAYGIGRTLSLPTCASRRPDDVRSVSACLASPRALLRAPALCRALDHFPAIFGALVLATGIDLWQHAIHANAHILTALLATCTLYFLLRWWRTGSNRWLYAGAFVAGLSPVQHPLLVFAFPAYILFGLFVLTDKARPARMRDASARARQSPSPRDGGMRPTSSCPTSSWALSAPLRLIGATVGFGLLGLTAYLYYPIRSAIGPPPLPGPTDMHTWAGFLRVVTAQGLRGNLGGFSFRQVLQRLWDVRVPLRLQYTVPGLLFAAIGFIHLWLPRRVSPSLRYPALLLTAYLACVLFVTVNVLQDEMAYLLGPMVIVGVLIGLGMQQILEWTLGHPTYLWAGFARLAPWRAVIAASVALAALILPTWSLAVNWTRMDLGDFRDADLWLQDVESRFVGRAQHAALLAEWERMTTVYYYAAVEGRTWDEEDMRFVPISAGTEAPFLQASEDNLSEGPVYLTSYRPKVAAKYRLMPSGNLWQVLPAWPEQLPTGGPTNVRPVHIAAGGASAGEASVEVVGWDLNRERVQPGDFLLLDLYMRLPDSAALAGVPYFLPWARLGETTYHFTTDSRFNTPWWQPGEIVVERFELPVPWDEAAGTLSLQVGLWLVNEGRALDLEGGQDAIPLTEVEIEPVVWRPSDHKLESALGNLRGDILLRDARVNGRSVRSLTDPDAAPIVLRPGTSLPVVLEWESLRPIDENLKVFVQLLDANLQVRAQGDDKAPLGGSAPTWLWFPRWRRGTHISDTYFLDVPSDLPPGTYPLVVGMYGFSTFKRVQTVSPDGDMGGDWITLGHLVVE